MSMNTNLYVFFSDDIKNGRCRNKISNTFIEVIDTLNNFVTFIIYDI